VANVAKVGPGESDWQHPSSEIVRFSSDDGAKTFQGEILEPLKIRAPHWLPNVERATGHNLVPEEPGIIYTAGGGGTGLNELELNNHVWWRPKN
jgi:hypothetical protein